MSTRSSIALKQADGTIRAMYCHNDGYLSWVGATLLDDYSTEERVKALLDLGDIRSLHEYLSEEDKAKGEKEGCVCFAYARDGEDPEEFTPNKIYENRDEFQAKAPDWYDAEYLYLFDDGKWYVFIVYAKDEYRGWHELTHDFINEMEG